MDTTKSGTIFIDGNVENVNRFGNVRKVTDMGLDIDLQESEDESDVHGKDNNDDIGDGGLSQDEGTSDTSSLTLRHQKSALYKTPLEDEGTESSDDGDDNGGQEPQDVEEIMSEIMAVVETKGDKGVDGVDNQKVDTPLDPNGDQDGNDDHGDGNKHESGSEDETETGETYTESGDDDTNMDSEDSDSDPNLETHGDGIMVRKEDSERNGDDDDEVEEPQNIVINKSLTINSDAASQSNMEVIVDMDPGDLTDLGDMVADVE